MKKRIRIAAVLGMLVVVGVTTNAMLLGDSARYSGPSCYRLSNGSIIC